MTSTMLPHDASVFPCSFPETEPPRAIYSGDNSTDRLEMTVETYLFVPPARADNPTEPKAKPTCILLHSQPWDFGALG